MSRFHDRRLSEHNHRLWVAYRHDLRIRNLSEHTITNYFQTLYAADNYFCQALGTLTRLDLKAFLAEQLETLAASTVHIHYVGLRVFYNWMIREELISASPMNGIPEPQVPDSPPRIVPERDLKALLKVCSGTSFRDRRDSALIRVMLEPGGPRRAEIVSLSLDSVDLDNELIMVRGKGSKVRYMPYGSRTGQALTRYLHSRQSHKHVGSDRLWLGRFGPLTIYALGQILETRCQQAGIERVKPHSLRHTSADRSMSAGISDLDMQTLFGWSSPAMLAVYARSNRAQRAITSARGKALGDKL
jgi:site-specific recombinase XerD